MNTQQERDRMDEAQDAGGAQNTEVTRSENRQAVANEMQHPARNDNPEGNGSERGPNLSPGHNDRGHEEGQYDKQTDQPEMNPGHVDQ